MPTAVENPGALGGLNFANPGQNKGLNFTKPGQTKGLNFTQPGAAQGFDPQPEPPAPNAVDPAKKPKVGGV
ncbi:MAG: hypothetical protein KIS92_09430 [Planctomycetota bacterium]|nr:hypothetical protein [Planctomycetota bacterium]